ncbi:MAG: DUF4340 domain-containing protein [Verrucomicrobiota bacterium]
MSWKNTWILVGVAAGLFAFIFFVERRLPSNGNQANAPRLVLADYAAGDVTAVEIQVGEKSLRVERTNAVWRVTAPVPYPAQQGRIQSLLEGCSKLRSQIAITTSEIANQQRGLADYGLHPPRITLRLFEGAKRQEVLIGDKTPVGERYYLQVGGKNEVYIVDDTFLQLLPRNMDEWRDNSMLNVRNLAFNRIEVRSGQRSFELQRDTNLLWHITKPMQARADNPKINRIVEELSLWPVRFFVSDDPNVPLEPYGLQPPQMELIFGQGSNDLAVVQFGHSPTNDTGLVYARRMSHTNVVLAPRDWLEPLRAPFTTFRDKRVLSFEAAQVEQIDIRSDETFSLRRATNGVWQVASQTNFTADAELVQYLLNNLAELEVIGADGFVKDVVTDFTPFGLEPALQQYTLLASRTNSVAVTNVVLAQLDLGSNHIGSVYARRVGEDSVYAVPVSDVRRLPKALYELRERRLWSFVGTNVTRVKIQQGGRARLFTRNTRNNLEENAIPPALAPLSTEATLENLGRLRAEKWVARGEERLAVYGIVPDGHEILFDVTNGERVQTYRLRLGKSAPSRNQYAALDFDGVPVVFELSRELYQDILRDLTLTPATSQ